MSNCPVAGTRLVSSVLHDTVALVLCACIVVEKENVLMVRVWGGDWTLVPDLSWSSLGKPLVRHTALWGGVAGQNINSHKPMVAEE